RIASMVLYEPSAFHLLRKMGSVGVSAFEESCAAYEPWRCHWRLPRCSCGLCRLLEWGRCVGRHASGSAGWAHPLVSQGTDFRALIEEATPPDAYRLLAFPILVLQGKHTPTPTR